MTPSAETPDTSSKSSKSSQSSIPGTPGNNDSEAAVATVSSAIQVGKPVPDFELPAMNANAIAIGRDNTVRLSDYRGRKVVIYFYPKDSTPACTQESCDFRDASVAFGTANAAILGISANDLKSHDKFAKKYELPFPLLADTEHRVCDLFGVWQEKQLYGRKYMGIVRSTFLIDENGILIEEWRNIRVKGHVDIVKQSLRDRA